MFPVLSVSLNRISFQILYCCCSCPRDSCVAHIFLEVCSAKLRSHWYQNWPLAAILTGISRAGLHQAPCTGVWKPVSIYTCQYISWLFDNTTEFLTCVYLVRRYNLRTLFWKAAINCLFSLFWVQMIVFLCVFILISFMKFHHFLSKFLNSSAVF